MNTPLTSLQNETDHINSNICKGCQQKIEQLLPILLRIQNIREFNCSIPSTISAAIRNWQSYLMDKPRFMKMFTPSGFDAAALEDFPFRVAMLWYFDGRLGQVMESAAIPPEVLAMAKPLLAKLRRAADFLFENHPTLGPVVRDIRQCNGRLDMAEALSQYALLFDEEWENVGGRSDVTRGDLDAANDVSARMLTGSERHEIEALRDLQNRAAEYLCRGTDTIRRAARYVFENNSEAMARYPSLYSDG